jgi:hypothetical protein
VEKISCGGGNFKFEVKIREGRSIQLDATTNEYCPKLFAFTTPSFFYAHHPVYAPDFVANGRPYRVVFEFRLKPGSFFHQGQTMGEDQMVDDDPIPSDEFEHFTARHGVMVLTGLIIVPQSRDYPRCGCAPWGLTPAPFPIISNMQLTCENARLRWQVLRHLGLNPMMFNHDHDMCYCGCVRRVDFIQEGHGDTIHRYVLPRPFTRFALHVDLRREKAWRFFTDWHTCFHGTTFNALPSIVDCGYLLYPGCVNVNGEEILVRALSPMRNEMAPDGICVSPSALYAGHPAYSSPCRFGNRVFSVILQFKIRPRSYKVCPSTIINFPEGTDPYIPNNQMEWHTKRHGTLVLYGVLLQEVTSQSCQ